ncbi:MAG: hypothetical protein K1X74_10960 [Pirellulales bacterium]|nr:hypothetical protein [Pirellulales bacterium]
MASPREYLARKEFRSAPRRPVGYVGQAIERIGATQRFAGAARAAGAVDSARFYDPTIGRFISQNPLGFGGGGTNLDAYSGNNPLLYSNPTGLKTLPEAEAAGKGGGRARGRSTRICPTACWRAAPKALNRRSGTIRQSTAVSMNRRRLAAGFADGTRRGFDAASNVGHRIT